MARYILTGAPGTGKTTVLDALTNDFAKVPEPARLVIGEHRAATGEPSLDHRPGLFVELLLERSIDSYDAAPMNRVTIFDRGIPDCAAYALVFDVDPSPYLEAAQTRRFDEPVFLFHPWRGIYTQDDMRRATFSQIETFHTALCDIYRELEYETVEVPQGPVAARAMFLTAAISR